MSVTIDTSVMMQPLFHYSYYNGLEANIVVNDLDMLQQVMVKQFDIFMDRAVCIILYPHTTFWQDVPIVTRDKSSPKGLLLSKGADWVRRRRISSKGFNAIKLKKVKYCTVASSTQSKWAGLVILHEI